VSAHYVIALDPGVTTGYAIGVIENQSLKFTCEQEKLSMAAMFDFLGRAIELGGQDLHIVYEKFTFRQGARTGLDFTPAKLIGIIELYRDWHEPIVRFYAQSASEGMGFFTDEKLKHMGAWAVGKEHGRAATKHMLQWLNFGAGAQFIDLRTAYVEMGGDTTQER
jgi:hypothetical protein